MGGEKTFRNPDVFPSYDNFIFSISPNSSPTVNQFSHGGRASFSFTSHMYPV